MWKDDRPTLDVGCGAPVSSRHSSRQLHTPLWSARATPKNPACPGAATGLTCYSPPNPNNLARKCPELMVSTRLRSMAYGVTFDKMMPSRPWGGLWAYAGANYSLSCDEPCQPRPSCVPSLRLAQ